MASPAAMPSSPSLCYASAVDTLPARPVHRVRSDASLRSAKREMPPADSSGLARFLSNKLRLLSKPRVLGLAVLWSAALWLIHWYHLADSALVSSTSRNAYDSVGLAIPTERAGQDSLDSVDQRYRPLIPLEAQPPPFPLLQPTRFLPAHCLESWFLDGSTNCSRADLGAEETLDATWLWVNGSDPRWRAELEHWKKAEGIYSPEHHFR